jgi:Tfp pilus assembly protein PilW
MRRIDLRDESGMTLIELLVATAAGVIVMFGITMAVIVTLRETHRVATHVDANQRARLAMTKIVNQLHSACVAPQITPIRSTSTGTTLVFWHQTGSAVAPTPIETKISLSGTTFTQSDYAGSGTPPNWTFATTGSTTTLMTGVSAISESIPVFRYYGYSQGQVSSTPFSTTSSLGTENAPKTVQVSIAFQAAPGTTPISDSGAKTGIQDVALLRLTPPAYTSSANNLPCQ